VAACGPQPGVRQCRGATALAALVRVGRQVQLEPDVEARDRYGRVLAYVWIGRMMVTWRMVRGGWAVLPRVRVSESLFRRSIMIELHDAERGTRLGTITDAQLKFLVDALEEESTEDTDYYISADTIDMLEEDGADAQLLGLLRGALAGREGMDVRWSRG
jgi:hypothetical protein